MSRSLRFDFVVIGGGVGGYPAAIDLARKGYRVALVERGLLGGECVNYGCIPTKAMVKAASLTRELEAIAPSFRSSVTFSEVVRKRNEVTRRVREGLEYLLEKNGVTVFMGTARLKSSLAEVEVTLKEGKERLVLEAEKVLLATGSSPSAPPGIVVDNERIFDSRGVLALEEPPRSLVIVGAGAVGVEYAFIFAYMGSTVTVVEKGDNVLPGMDDDVRLAVRRALARAGVRFVPLTPVEGVTKEGSSVIVMAGGERLRADAVLVATGRKPNTAGIGLEEAGVATDRRGFIVVNEYLETTNPRVYAVGDAVGDPMLAHKAIYQSLVAARNMEGSKVPFLKRIPIVVYSIPYAAGVGVVATKEDVAEGRVRAARFSYAALPMALIEGYEEGFLKVVYDRSGRVVGAHAFGPGSDMLIALMTLAIEKGLTVQDLAETVLPHPSVSEAAREASLIALGEPIHTVLVSLR